MTPAARKRLGCLLWPVGLVAIVLLAPIQTIIWDGGFSSAEYRLTFVDEAGRPVPGVVLRVETQAGGVSHLYPVDEFLPDQAPTSDADGRMVFHHAGTAIEFSGHERGNLVGMEFGNTGAPRYVLVFSVGNREVHRLRHDDLRPRDDWDRRARVKRAWQYPDWPSREYAAHHEEWDNYRDRLFDGDGDGKLGHEERVARGYFERVMYRAEDEPGPKEIEFFVVERTITVSVP
jgi:hypothetical protein